ncbi:MAG: hypothetical protein WCG16_13555 [Methylococcales bacterium]
MAIYKTNHHIKFLDGIHELNELIELDTDDAKLILGITEADIEQLLRIGAIEKQLISEPVVPSLEMTDSSSESTKLAKSAKPTQ